MKITYNELLMKRVMLSSWIHDSQVKLLTSNCRNRDLYPLKKEYKSKAISYLEDHTYFPFAFDVIMNALDIWQPQVRKLLKVPYNYDFNRFIDEVILYRFTRKSYVAVQITANIWVALRPKTSLQDIGYRIDEAKIEQNK